MNERDADFEMWWSDQDYKFRDDIRKKDANRIWNAGFKAGGKRPWWSINQEQWAVLSKKLGGEK
jgi:hypothetical protein